MNKNTNILNYNYFQILRFNTKSNVRVFVGIMYQRSWSSFRSLVEVVVEVVRGGLGAGISLVGDLIEGKLTGKISQDCTF